MKAEQEQFSGQALEALADPAPDMDIHVICKDDKVVGMFRIDRRYHQTYSFAGHDTLGLRMFMIDQAKQGQGLGKASCMLLRSYLAQQYPKARAVYLTVNLINPAAKAIYLSGGFTDTGQQWTKGDAGPQNILRLDLV